MPVSLCLSQHPVSQMIFSLRHVTGLVRSHRVPRLLQDTSHRNSKWKSYLLPSTGWFWIMKCTLYLLQELQKSGCVAFNFTAAQQDCLVSRGEWLSCKCSSVSFIWSERLHGYFCAFWGISMTGSLWNLLFYVIIQLQKKQDTSGLNEVDCWLTLLSNLLRLQ